MDKKFDLPFGPWYEIFSGTWANYDVTLLQNPDKLTLNIIFDKDRDKVTGMVFILNKYYVSEGDPSRLSSVLGGYNIIFEKMYPTFKKKFLVISSGPKYASSEKEEIDASLQEIFNAINDRSERANELSKSFNVNLTEIKYAEEAAIGLFSEPIIMSALTVQKTGEASPAKALSKTLLGKKSTSENAEESAQSFTDAIVIGVKEEREQMMHVLLENCVLSGLTTVVFDDSRVYEKMSNPNKNFDFKAFPDLQPIGMPLKNVSIQEVGINLNMLSPEMFREVLGVVSREKDYQGKVSAELIDEVIANSNGQLKSLADIQEKLLEVRDEVKKFYIYRAVRMLKVLDMAYPNFFGGRVDLTLFISPYLRSIGSIVRIEAGDIPKEIRAVLVYSVMASLYNKYKEEMATKEVKVIAFIPDGKEIAPGTTETVLQREMVTVLSDCNKYGVGFCIGAEHETELSEAATGDATIKLEMLGDEEVAVKESHSRPYRMKIRPNFSA